MTTTVQVSISARLLTGAALPNARVTFERTGPDVEGAIIVPQSVTVSLNASGDGTATLGSNAAGTQGTRTLVYIYDATGVLQFSGIASIPSTNCNLHDVLNLTTPTVNDAQAAVNQARGYRDQAQAVLADSGFVSVKNDLTNINAVAASVGSVNSVAADVTNINAVAADLAHIDAVAADLTRIDAVAADLANIDAVAGDRTNIDAVAGDLANINIVAGDKANVDLVAGSKANVDTVAGSIASVNSAATNMAAIIAAPTQAAAAAGSATSANSNMLTAIAQASLASIYALSAASVAQQDISGVTDAALHRSPNAIVCPPILIDPSKDSNPLWPQQCGHLSWANRVLNGTWLGWQAAEASARAVNGTLGTEAVTGADPTFASATGWATGAGHAISGGFLNLTIAANGTATTTTGTASVIGTVYKVSCTRSLTAGGIRVTYGGKTFDFYAGSGDPIYLAASAVASTVSVSAIGTTTGSVDSVSIKPVTANVTNTGDYFGNSTDGKFYTLNAGSGVTETFDGNTNKFGRMVAVAEASRVVLYAIDQPGRPMWMVFTTGGAGSLNGPANFLASGTVGSMAYANGLLVTGSSGGNGILQIDFAKDKAQQIYSGGVLNFAGGIATRNSQPYRSQGATTPAIANSIVNAVAMTTLPDAPVDPVTGLQVPTIAVATAGGISVIKSDGTVVNSSSTASYSTIAINPYLLTSSIAASLVYALTPGQLGASFALPALPGNAAPGFTASAGISAVSVGGRGTIAARTANGLSIVRLNEANPAASPVTQITPTSASGLWAGDIRRCWLSDTLAGTADGTNLATGDSSTFTAGVGLWVQGTTCTLAAVSGELQVTQTGVNGRAVLAFPAVIGKTYAVSADVRMISGAGANIGLSNSNDGLNNATFTQANTTSSVASRMTSVRVADATTMYVVGGFNGGSNSVMGFDNIVIQEVAAERSYKNKPLTIVGALTRAAVGLASQLVGYTAWSAANYLQEAYSADHDLATICVPVWLKYSTAAVGTVFERAAASGAFWSLTTDATGKLVGTVSDGTTTRTATTSAAYNTGAWLQAMLTYNSAGTVAIWVNGVMVVSAAGAPLGSLVNASAVFTVGNNRATTAPFPSTDYISIMDVGATVPTPDSARWMYEQEKEMFRDGAQVTLPDSGALVSIAYDASQAKWKTASAANEASFVGLVRTAFAPVSAGSITQVGHDSGIRVLARSTTNPGVDITIPAKNLGEEVAYSGASEAAKRGRMPEAFDWTATFTANTVINDARITVTGSSLVYPASAPPIGAIVSGTGIPANTTVLDVQGTTVFLSTPCTATASGITVTLMEYPLPTGYEVAAGGVFANRLLQTEGATFDYTRKFDGFRERPSFGSTPSGRVRINGRRTA